MSKPEYFILCLILITSCSTFYFFSNHDVDEISQPSYKHHKQLRHIQSDSEIHGASVCRIEAECSKYATCISGECMAFWPTNKSEVFCPCLNDIINYEDHFYRKSISSIHYYKGVTPDTCVVKYRWGSYNSTGSSVEEYEKDTTGAFLRREQISENSFVALCKNTQVLRTSVKKCDIDATCDTP